LRQLGQGLDPTDEGVALGREAVTGNRCQRREIRAQIGRDNLQQALGIEQALQAMLAHLPQRDTVWQSGAQNFRRHGGDQDLLAMGDGHDPRRAIQRRAEIIAFAQFRHAGVQAHSHAQRDRRLGIGRRRLRARDAGLRRLQGALRREARGERVRRRFEDGEKAVPRGLHDATGGILNRTTQQRVVPRECDLHRVRILIPQRGAALDVGEEECERAGGQR
jgi:hypothetical protein